MEFVMRTTIELALEIENVISRLEATTPRSRRIAKLKAQLAELLTSIE